MKTPVVYTIESNHHHLTWYRSTLDSAVALLKREKCPASIAADNSPVRVHFDDDTDERADLSAYLEEMELPVERIAELTAELDATIQKSREQYDRAHPSLKPGEIRPPPFSSFVTYIHTLDRQDLLNRALRKERLRWKS